MIKYSLRTYFKENNLFRTRLYECTIEYSYFARRDQMQM